MKSWKFFLNQILWIRIRINQSGSTLLYLSVLSNHGMPPPGITVSVILYTLLYFLYPNIQNASTRIPLYPCAGQSSRSSRVGLWHLVNERATRRGIFANLGTNLANLAGFCRVHRLSSSYTLGTWRPNNKIEDDNRLECPAVLISFLGAKWNDLYVNTILPKRDPNI